MNLDRIIAKDKAIAAQHVEDCTCTQPYQGRYIMDSRCVKNMREAPRPSVPEIVTNENGYSYIILHAPALHPPVEEGFEYIHPVHEEGHCEFPDCVTRANPGWCCRLQAKVSTCVLT